MDEEDPTLAEDGFSNSIANESGFIKNNPLAVSTVARDAKKRKEQNLDEKDYESFLDMDNTVGSGENLQMQNLKLSFSAIDQSSPGKYSQAMPGGGPQASRSEPVLTDKQVWQEDWAGVQHIPECRGDVPCERTSSLGLINVEEMSDLSASVLNIGPPSQPQPKPLSHNQESLSSSNSNTGSLMASLGSMGQWTHPNMETVKKKPPVASKPVKDGDEVRKSLAFTGGPTMEEDEADITIPEVQFREDEINQLDDEFSYFEEPDDTLSDEEMEEEVEGRPGESGVPREENEGDGNDRRGIQTQSRTPEAVRSRIAPKVDSGLAHSAQDFGFHSDSDMDTEDELELARNASEREKAGSRSQTLGQSLEDPARGGRERVTGSGPRESSQQLSIHMRQSAEGDVVSSPVPGDGGGGGDGSSDSESGIQMSRFADQQSCPPFDRSHAVSRQEQERVRPLGDDLLTEKGLNRYGFKESPTSDDTELNPLSKYLVKTVRSNETTHMGPSSGLDSSTFCLDDLLQGPGPAEGDRSEASGFNADDANNPFGAMENSFGSFGKSPDRLGYSGAGADAGVQELALEDDSVQWSRSQNLGPGDPFSPGNAEAFSQSVDEENEGVAGPVRTSGAGQDRSLSDVVYKDQNGEFVTDLAYFQSFAHDAEEQQKTLQTEMALGHIPANMTFDENDFISADDAKDMLEKDQAEFEEENIFRPDDVFEDKSILENSSWEAKSKLYLSCPSASRSDLEASKVSIGTFLKSRSGALGSLDGDANVTKPEFGMKCKSPPSRRPMPLLDIAADGFDSESEDSAVNRTAGVGNEQDATLVTNEMSVSELLATPTPDSCTFTVPSPANSKNDSVFTSLIEQTFAEQSASKSDISRFLSTVKGNPSEQELVQMILEFSASKSKGTQPKTTFTQQREETEGLAASVAQKTQVSAAPVKEQGSVASSQNISQQSIASSAADTKTGPSCENEKDAKIAALETEIMKLRAEMVMKSVKSSVSRLSLEDRESIDGKSDATHKQTGSLRMIPADGEASRIKGVMKMTADPPPTSGDFGENGCSPVSVARMSDSFKRFSTASSVHDQTGSILHDARSPRSSTTTGLTGHHIPDGTDYSFHGDNQARDMSREDMVGVEDIETADSRGFDFISGDQAGELFQNMDSLVDKNSSRCSAAKPRKGSGASSLASSPSNQNRRDSSLLSNSSVTNRSSQEFSTSKSKVSGANEFVSPKQSQAKTVTCDKPCEKPEKLLTQAEIDSLCMPPPPVPGAKPNPSKRKKEEDMKDGSSTPLLMTSTSLLSTNFAQEFMKRDAPSYTAQLQSSKTDASLTFNPYLDQTSIIPRLHDTSTTSGATGRQVGNSQSLFAHHPMYHSTPFPKNPAADASVVNESQFLPMDNLIMTNSTMHTMMATGHGEEKLEPSQQESPDKGRMLVPVQAPNVLQFPEVCCVGISRKHILPLTNPNDQWLECHLEVNLLTLDGHQVNNDSLYPFDIRPKVVIQPKKTEEVSVIVLPIQPGNYVAQLTISSILFIKDKDTDVMRTEVSIKVTAEVPQIKIDIRGHLDFGPITWGTCKEKTFSIVNHGRAMVPLRLAIHSNKKQWHCFMFEQRSGLGDISVISRSSRPQSSALSKGVITLCLPGRESDQPPEPYEVRVYCRPPEKQLDKALLMQPAESMMASIDIAVDTPSSQAYISQLASIDLLAQVGVAKLHIIKNLEAIHLMASESQKVSYKVTLKNVGNIDLWVEVSTEAYDNVFSVVPPTLSVPPASEADVSVQFCPRMSNVQEFNTVLLMGVLPDGPTYQLPLKGQVVKSKELATYRGKQLLSDKQFLCYGGVQIGKTLIKKTTIFNKSPQPCAVRLEIRSSSGEFQLQGSFSTEHDDLPSRARDVYLKPMEKHPVPIIYAPTTVDECTGKLIIKPCGQDFKYSIPLYSYGGTSDLLVEEAHLSGKDRYWVEMGPMMKAQKMVKKVVLRNMGDRPAYITALCCTDLRCKQLLGHNRVLVEPNDFILPEQTAKTVLMVLNTSQREAALCSDHKHIVGVVMFLYGDEASRQRYRRSLKNFNHPPKNLSKVELVNSVNFDLHFLGEEAVPALELGQQTGTAQTYVDLFYNNMSMALVSLVGEPHTLEESITVTPPVHMKDTVYDRYQGVDILPEPEPQKKLSASMEESLPVTEASSIDNGCQERWSLKPQRLVLYVPLNKSDKPRIYKFQILNYLSRPIRYELSWPGHWIKVSPECDTIQAKSVSTVCLSPTPAAMKNVEQLPWSGSLQVNCDGITKALNLQIRGDAVAENLVVDRTLVPLSSQSLPARTSTGMREHPDKPFSNTSGPQEEEEEGEESCLVAPKCLATSCTNVSFSDTPVGGFSEFLLDLENFSQENVRWIVSSFAPPYVKGAENAKEVFRATYKVFDFSEKYGNLSSNEKIQLKISFMPRSKASFLQYWDIQSKSTTGKPNHDSNTIRLHLSGRGVEEEKMSMTTVTMASTLSKSLASNAGSHISRGENRDCPVVFKDALTEICFPSCPIGSTNMQKIKVKNVSSTIHSVEVVQPTSPFYVRHSCFKIKSRNFLSYPVEFIPKRVGHFESVLIFRVDSGYSLSLKIHGECV